MKIYIVRHGQTEWNYKKVMQGSIDIPLNNNGKEQAKNARELLADKPFDIIISSPLLRAKETAEIINEKFNKELIIDNRLAERNYGIYEGRKKEEIPYNDFWDYNLNGYYEKSENIKEFYDRVMDLINELKNKYENKDILLVTHAGVCKALELYFNPDSENSNNGKLGPYLPNNSEIIEYSF